MEYLWVLYLVRITIKMAAPTWHANCRCGK
jgi:hypothetical protein